MQKEELIKELERRYITRGELVEIFGISDEKIRNEILAPIRKKYPLVNFGNNKGYHISYNPTDIQRMIRQEKARANQIYQNVKVLEAWFGKCGGKEETDSINEHCGFLESLMEA